LWQQSLDKANVMAAGSFGYFLLGVGIWFIIAWFSHQSLINKETHARPLERSESTKVYNLLENLCISRGLKMPKLFIIDSDVLNAYASGINEKTYAITLTQGIINKLEDDELEAVIAHELSHIMNRDVRLLIISIIFVGIISMISEVIVRGVTRGAMGGRGSGKKGGGHIVMILIVIAVAAIGYLLSILIRFTLSRKREYLADAGAVELTRNSDALIRALHKISGNSNLQGVDGDVKQMMIDNDVSFLGMFATHPPIEDRINVLKGF
jgi:heat shock protein HtpX